ncbi:porin family protein [Niabella hirudinis]|uniref:porin family protein n=1 Tax=Niabella hirudinis TaxID=1285929 RepID=UPI003EB7A0B5
MNDEELDKLFRDAASRFQPPDVPEGAWEAFYRTKMLPVEKSAEPRRFFMPRRFWQLAAACLLLALTGLVWILRQQPAPGPGGSRSSAQIATGIFENQSAGPVIVPGNNETDNGSLNTNRPDLAATLSEYKEQPAVNNNRVFIDALQHVEARQKHPAPDTVKPGSPSFSLRDKPAQKPTGQRALPGYYNPPDAVETPRTRNAGGRWQVGLLAGSNLGMVRGGVSKKPGLNAGLLVQKKLGQSRFSVESGVLYESMTYAVNNEDFNPNGKPVSSKVSNIEGSCSMIDVPVNVRYDVVTSRKNKAFVSTGVSPTVILKQSYVYDFDRGEGPVPVTRDVSGKGKSVYAVANLSIGYEQKWEHVSVQITPYVKIPMGEIGYGNLSLGGVGTQISIKKDL